jgi:hypothetical protein
MDAPKPYLSAEELAQRTPWTPNAIEKMIARGVLTRGVHFFQFGGRRSRLIFKWDAIVELIERQGVRRHGNNVVETTKPYAARMRRTLNVETATTALQRLLR